MRQSHAVLKQVGDTRHGERPAVMLTLVGGKPGRYIHPINEHRDPNRSWAGSRLWGGTGRYP